MKTIEQLLHLSKNPYYAFTAGDKKRLDDFLGSQQEKASVRSPKKRSKESSEKTPVIVRNVVKKFPAGVVEEASKPEDRVSS